MIGVVLLFLLRLTDACTAIAIEKDGTVDGSTLNSHTNDCRQCDFRLAYVPAAHRNKTRNIYALRPEYPRYVGEEWGPVYSIDKLDRSIYPWKESVPVGHIDEVRHTYAYLDSSFPLINEHQVAMGESTCSAKLVSHPTYAGGHALLEMTTLTRIALERCKTARCAIQTIGELAQEHGFYGEDWSGNKIIEYSEAGEGMAITDPEEAWVMNILPDDTGRGAVWAAQRVPKGHIAPIVNEFTIKEMDLSRSDWFMASPNVHEVAIRNGFWSPKDGPFNFMKAYTYDTDSKKYSGRRQWRILSLAAPSLNLSPDTSMFDLPFSVPVDKKFSVADLSAILRDHYEGTPYDQTVGPAAGPFGDPNRYDRGAGSGANPNITSQGQFERSISIFRASFSYVAQSRSWLPDIVGGRVWFGHYAPHATAYVPFYVTGDLPESYSQGSLQKFDTGAFWAFLTVGNWADKMYKYIMEDVRQAQTDVEENGFTEAEKLEREVVQLLHSESNHGHGVHKAKEKLTKWANNFATKTVEKWWDLFELLVTKWHDNYRMDGLNDESIKPVGMFWPQWWLEMVGYYSPDVLAQIKANESASSAFDATAILGVHGPPPNFLMAVLSVFVLTLVAFGAGLLLGYRYKSKHAHRHEYEPLA